MHRIFLPVYHFFKERKALLYALLIASTAVFAWFGCKIQLEEDIVKLLPRSSTSNELAFSDIGLIDKIFVQVTSRDTLNPVPTKKLGQVAEQFCQAVMERDSATHYLTGALAGLSIDTAMEAMDFGLTHLPTFIDTAWYKYIDAALEPEAFAEQMEANYQLVMEDETGDDSQLASMDPLGLRNALFQDLFADSNMGGFAMVDGHLFCPDKTVALGFLTPGFAYTNSGEATRMIAMLDKVRAEMEAEHPDIRILMHGNPHGSVSNADTIKSDLIWTISLSLLLILLIMILSFHHLSFIWQQVVPVVYGAVFALACMYWLKGVMSLMALGLSAVVMGVAISYCLHLLIHYYYKGDAEQTLRDESTPIFLGCLTTIGAFLGLLFTESDLLRDFGLFATFALIGSTFYALVFLPHFLKKEDVNYKKYKGFHLIDRINGLPWDRNPWILGALVALLAVGIVFSPKVGFDSDLRNLNYVDIPLDESQRLYSEKNESGHMNLYFAAYDNDFDKALEYDKLLGARLDSLQRTGLVKRYSSIVSLLFQTEQEQTLRIDAWKKFWTPQRIEKARRDLSAAARRQKLDPGLFEPFFALVEADYLPGNLYEAGLIPDALLSSFIEKQDSGRWMIFSTVAFAPEDMDTVTDALVSGPQTVVLEPFYYCRDMVQIVHDDFQKTLLISSLFVLLVLLISFRNLWVSLVAFFPMFLSWYALQGFMALFGLGFNLINIVIATFVFGIGVDYSIFVMEGLLQEARTGEKTRLEYHKVAIFFSALILIIVVGSLVFARHPAISSTGRITLIGMVFTILMTYSLEPFVFRKLLKTKWFRRSLKLPEK